MLVPEYTLNPGDTVPGESHQQLIRADMTFFETPAGGAVFSNGSITFCGSLLSDQEHNDVSRLTHNVIDRFLDPKPFSMP